MNTTRPAEWPKSGWYWHLHHDRLYEWTYDIDKRWDYIVAKKPAEELETRLRLIAPIRDVPDRLQKADAEYRKTGVEWQKADAEWQKAYAGLQKARVECAPKMEALHAAQCPNCPWDGKTIFPERRKQ